VCKVLSAVVLAKARTHYHRQMSCNELVVPACATTQSWGNGSWIALALLACPGRRKTFPRRAKRPSFTEQRPSKKRGAGSAGCRLHPWPACNKKSRRQ
jgi:hypothetical protein